MIWHNSENTEHIDLSYVLSYITPEPKEEVGGFFKMKLIHQIGINFHNNKYPVMYSFDLKDANHIEDYFSLKSALETEFKNREKNG